MNSWEGAVDHAANARLVAAAPEMYEAIQAIVTLADGQGQRNLMECAGRARQLLAKIEGRRNRG